MRCALVNKEKNIVENVIILETEEGSVKNSFRCPDHQFLVLNTSAGIGYAYVDGAFVPPPEHEPYQEPEGGEGEHTDE